MTIILIDQCDGDRGAWTGAARTIMSAPVTSENHTGSSRKGVSEPQPLSADAMEIYKKCAPDKNWPYSIDD